VAVADRLHTHRGTGVQVLKGETMRRTTILGAAAVAALLSAGAAQAQQARAELKDANGTTVGQATLEQKGDSVRIAATFTGLPAGSHAFHIHEVGKCEPPFESAGAHFNPTGKQHGRDNAQGPHAGDLPNVEVTSGGRGKVEATTKGVSLDGGKTALLDADGAALVVHEKADDYKTDPGGGAGKRIACGVLRR
jgi:superoxide dismutase, Cu-Zn family